MVERSQMPVSVTRYGISERSAETQLTKIGWWTENGPQPTAEAALNILSRVADPDLAVRGLTRLSEADKANWARLNEQLLRDRVLCARLLGVLGFSHALSDFLVAEPTIWHRLIVDTETPVANYVDCLRIDDKYELEEIAEVSRLLRRNYRALVLEIAAGDLGAFVSSDDLSASYVDITHKLTALAEAVLSVSVELARKRIRDAAGATLAIIAMGKCGGRELNYVSDVDIIFVGDDGRDGTLLAAEVMRIASACFDVDANLRPEGKSGPLVRTLEGYVAYYQKWAHTWEFQALLKARPVAGDIDLGNRYLALVAPMVWSAAERQNFVSDVQKMRRRVEQHVSPNLVNREIKLGRGGLRDVEFAVQLLQMVHGRVDDGLRSPSTVEALKSLGARGYISRVDAAELAESYEFLRLIEHRLQLRRLRRTHTFPDVSDVGELKLLAHSVGIRATRDSGAVEILVADFRKHSNNIQRLHQKLFYRPLLQAVANVPNEALRLTTDQAISRLSALGYAAPEGALRHITALTSGVSRRAAIQQTLLPVLLDLLATTPDPDGGLLSYRQVSEALEETPWYLRVLRDEGAVFERLAWVLGRSKLVPDLLTRAPEVLHLLGDLPRLSDRSPEDVSNALFATVRRQPSLSAAVASARSARRHELLRVAAADLLGQLDVETVCGLLSNVWESVLHSVLDAVIAQELGEDKTAPARISVIAMGRLGGRELGYGSDADVLFVCEAHQGMSETDATRFAATVAEKVRSVLAAPSPDPALQVDADLRPEGRQGPLVRTLDSYRAYYARWSEIWEAQALLRARFIAGDADLGQRFIQMVDPIRYPAGGLEATKIREIRRIKARVEIERMPRGADPTLHTKLGRGGLADIEWTVQLIQLRYANEFSELRNQSTIDSLMAAKKCDVISAKDADTLASAWRLVTRVRNVSMLVRGKPTDQLATSGRELAAVSSIFGYSPDDPGEFVDDYRRMTRRAHAIVQRLFYEN